MTVVLDTCAVLSWLVQRRPLPTSVGPGPRLVSAVTWYEIAWKHRVGRLPLPLARDAWLASAMRLVTTVPVDAEVFLAAVDLDWPHRDPADRLIVALAQGRNATLVTCDRAITVFHPKCLW
jgi:PIN domain nuclease of toxin-antitoxin system